MRVVVLWAQMSRYMGACWRSLASLDDVDLHVVATLPSTAPRDGDERAFDQVNLNAPYSLDVMKGVPSTLVSLDEMRDGNRMQDIVRSRSPEALFVSGWWSDSYRRVLRSRMVPDSRTVLAFDTPFSNGLRHRATAIRHMSVFRSARWAFVPGERSFLAARRLGFPEDRVRKGLYGIAASEFAPLYMLRAAVAWPRRFLYLGKLVEAKGISTLVAGYSLYRQSVSDPWPLTVCGQGPLEGLIRNEEGVQWEGFVQADQLKDLVARSGASVLASRFDPWPLALVEAASAGLPIVCSMACGSHVELVRDFYNGRLFGTGDASALASCLKWIHVNYECLPELGRRSFALAECYNELETALRWAEFSRRVAAI